MRILYTTRTFYDGLYLALSGIYDGTPLDIVLEMKRTTVFGDRASLDQYLEFHRHRLFRVYGYEIPAVDSTPEARATAFLDALLTLGIVSRFPDDPEKGHDNEV